MNKLVFLLLAFIVANTSLHSDECANQGLYFGGFGGSAFSRVIQNNTNFKDTYVNENES